MSIPGHVPQGVSRLPAPTDISDTRGLSQPATTGTTAASPIMQSRPTPSAEQKLREIYLSMNVSNRNGYLDQKIGVEMGPEFIAGTVTKDSQTPDVDSADFKYHPESFRLIRRLLDRQEYEALGLLLEKCPRISEETIGKASFARTDINFDKLDESNVAALIRAFNCSARAVPLNIECVFHTPEGCEKAIKFLNACTKVSYLSLTVKPGDERFLKCISNKKEIKNLYCFGFKDGKDSPKDQPIREYLDMLANMPNLERIELDENKFKGFPVVLTETLKSLSGAPNLKSLRCPQSHTSHPTLRKDLIDLIPKLPGLSEFVLEFSRKDSHAELLEIEEMMAALQKNSSIKRLHISYSPSEENLARFFELVSNHPSVTQLEIYNPQYLPINALKQISELLRKSPQIVKAFPSFNDRNWAADLSQWKDFRSARECYQEFLLICDLIDKNRARATLAETYGNSFSQYGDGNQAVALSGPAWLPQDVGNLIAGNILDLSPNVNEFERVMRVVNRSALEADLKNTAQAGAIGVADAAGPIRTTMDVTNLTTTSMTTTTTTTTTTPGSGGVGSTPLQAVSSQASSAAAADDAEMIQPSEAGQITTPPNSRIDTGYESDVFIESSDDDE